MLAYLVQSYAKHMNFLYRTQSLLKKYLFNHIICYTFYVN